MRNFVKSIYKGVLLFAAISVATVSNAQDYDLNNYKFRYQKYRGLSFDFSLSSGGRQEFNNSQNVKDSSEVYQNNGTNNNGFRIMPTYFLYENTDKLQRSTSISVEEDFVGTFSKQRVPGTLDSRKTGSNILNITYSTNNRFYTGNRFKYFYFYSRNGIDLNSSSYKGKSNIGVDSKSKGQSVGYSNNTNVSYGFGTGRLEYVTDAVQAMFIAENLNLIGKETLTNNQIEKVAQGITQIRNARYLDYRIGYKTQLTMLDSILQANGISGEKSIAYFTVLSDNWLYANRIGRFSGARWTHFINVNDDYHFVKSNSYSKSVSEDYYYNVYQSANPKITLNTSYSNSTQKSLHVERSYGFNVRGGIVYNHIQEASVNQSSTPINKDSLKLGIGSEWMMAEVYLGGNYSYLFQSNTRNYFTVNIYPSITYRTRLPKYSGSSTYHARVIEPNLVMSATYYHWFSPNLAINGNFNIGTNNNQFSDAFDENWHVKGQRINPYYNLFVGVVYQLF